MLACFLVISQVVVINTEQRNKNLGLASVNDSLDEENEKLSSPSTACLDLVWRVKTGVPVVTSTQQEVGYRRCCVSVMVQVPRKRLNDRQWSR